MKKLILTAINIIIFSLTLCFADCTNEMILEYESNCYNNCNNTYNSCVANGAISNVIQGGGTSSTTNTCYSTFQSCKSSCDDATVEYQDNDCPGNEIDTGCNSTNCPNWICQDNVCVENLYWDAGININKDCLLNWQCSMNVYKTLWIRKSNPDPSVKVFAQDIILWASMFFGTIMTVLLIVSGLSYVMAWYTGKSPDKAKKMMVWSIIWLLFVTFSYTIIRLIQFLATWWS